MALFDMFTKKHAGKSAQQKFDALSRLLIDTEAERERLNVEIKKHLGEALLGNVTANKSVAPLMQKRDECDESIGDLKESIQHAANELAAEQRETEKRKAEEHERLKLKLRDRKLETIKLVQHRADEFADALRQDYAAGEELAEAIGTSEAARVFGFNAFAERINLGLSKTFWITPKGTHDRNLKFFFLSPVVSTADERAKRSLLEEAERVCAIILSNISGRNRAA
jgi:hypothetical protein